MHSNQRCGFIHGRDCDCLGCSLNRNNFVFLLPVWLSNQSSRALGVSWRSQGFAPPSMCLTSPLWGTCPSLPKRLWGPWSALGCSCCHILFLSLFCQTICLSGRPWLPFLCFKVLISFTRSDFTCQIHGTLVCALAFMGETNSCVFSPMSAGTCHRLFTCRDHFQPNPCHFLQLQRDHLQPQQPQHPHFHCSFHHG